MWLVFKNLKISNSWIDMMFETENTDVGIEKNYSQKSSKNSHPK